jgi:hypothetical protein
MWICFMTLGVCQLYYVGPLNKVRIFIYYSYIQVDTWKYGWSYTLGIIHKIHCFIPTLFIPVVFIEILFIVALTLKILTLFILSTGINFFMFPKFLPIKVR